MSHMFGGPSLPPVPTTPPTPTPATAVVQAAGDNARLAASQAAGPASTILTSGQGDLSSANTTKKTLLGG